MPNQQTMDSISIGIVAFVGIAFFVLSSLAFQNFDASCPSFTLRNGWSIIQALGACMAVAGIYYFMCVYGGGRCYTSTETIRTSEMYFIIFAIFFLFILGMGSAMLKEYTLLTSEQLDTACDNPKRSNKLILTFIVAISAIGLIFSTGYLIRMHFYFKKLGKI